LYIHQLLHELLSKSLTHYASFNITHSINHTQYDDITANKQPNIITNCIDAQHILTITSVISQFLPSFLLPLVLEENFGA